MKEELQGKLVEILTSIQAAAGKASDFALEQLPDIAQSYVMYGRVWETTCFAFTLIALAACLRLLRQTLREGGGELLIPVGGITAVVFLIAGAQAKGTALVWFAPKVWLLKEIASLIR